MKGSEFIKGRKKSPGHGKEDKELSIYISERGGIYESRERTGGGFLVPKPNAAWEEERCRKPSIKTCGGERRG